MNERSPEVLLSAWHCQAASRQTAEWLRSLTAAQATAALQQARRELALHDLLGLTQTAWHRLDGHALRYPRWQFQRAVLPHIPAVLRALPLHSPWLAHDFLVAHNDLLGESPLAALRHGRAVTVLEAARCATDDY